MASKNKPVTGPVAKKKLLIVDDHPMTRLGQVETLNRETDFMVCGETGTAREAMEAIVRLKPDLVVTDLTLPDKDGLELLKDIQALHPGLPTLVVSMHDEMFYAPRVLRAGGRGYVMKSEGPEKVVGAIRAVLSGQIALSAPMSARLLETFTGQSGKSGGTPESKLTDRELEALRFFGEGWATEEIAQKMHLSTKTVDVHRGKIKEKLGFNTTPELLRFAIRWVQAQEWPALPAAAPDVSSKPSSRRS
ncbi:MAG: response regulator transcription factor [Verrucomicrobiales bacterium]|nr:response regulator transcription factor [Verrucomicrobiales bacterium]